MGEFAQVTDHMRAALDKAGQPVRRGTMAHDHDVFAALADAAGQLRDASGLRHVAPRLESLATRDGHRLYLAVAHRAWGVAHRLAGEWAQAEGRLRQALALFAELGTRWQAGRTRLELADLALAAGGDRDVARDHLAHALDDFEAAGAGPDAEATRGRITALD